MSLDTAENTLASCHRTRNMAGAPESKWICPTTTSGASAFLVNNVEWQHIGNQIDPSMIFARTNFVTCFKLSEHHSDADSTGRTGPQRVC